MEAPEISWRPLGQLFVEKGLLDEERLEYALAEQAANGGRLGEKLVELRYVSSAALARLLAEQYGVELAVDTGFGTGLGPSSSAGTTTTGGPNRSRRAGSGDRARRAVGAAAGRVAAGRRHRAGSPGSRSSGRELAAAEAASRSSKLELAAALDRAEQSAAEAAFLTERLREQEAADRRPPPRTAARASAGQEAPAEVARLTRQGTWSDHRTSSLCRDVAHS